MLGGITPDIGVPSYRVVWNQLDPEYILMSSSNGRVYVIKIEDPPECKTLVIVNEYSVEANAYGVCWNPFKGTEFVAAYGDANVRLFDFNKQESKPLKTFIGH